MKRIAVQLRYPDGRLKTYLMPEGTSAKAANIWGYTHHRWPDSVFVEALLDPETDEPETITSWPTGLSPQGSAR